MLKVVVKKIMQDNPQISAEELYLKVLKQVSDVDIEDMGVGEFFRKYDDFPKISTVRRYRRFYQRIL